LVMRDLRAHGCDLLTLGQYLRPSPAHLPVIEYITPARFEALREKALQLGFSEVAAGPLVRSSYRADVLHQAYADHD
ncbi:MAG: lipoyl synthase, partial [Methyloversatilis sp. 12-65-5]